MTTKLSALDTKAMILLRERVATTCPTRAEQVRLIDALGLRVSRIALDGASSLAAYAILDEASKQGRTLEAVEAAVATLASPPREIRERLAALRAWVGDRDLPTPATIGAIIGASASDVEALLKGELAAGEDRA